MFKYETKMVPRENVKIYCDNCGKFLKETISWDDGYFENEFEVKQHDWNAQIEVDGYSKKIEPEYGSTLCPECKKEFAKKLEDLVELAENLFDEFSLREKDEEKNK